MRIIPSVFAFVALIAPVLAMDWTSYANARFGFQIDVPPGFTGKGESSNGDGQTFSNEAGSQVLTVWGGNTVSGDFETEVAERKAQFADGGWTVNNYASTPAWATISGGSGDTLFDVRIIALCSGSQYAAFHMAYLVKEQEVAAPLVDRLSRSLQAAGDGAGC